MFTSISTARKTVARPRSRIILLKIVPEILHAEILPVGGQFSQAVGNPLPGLRFPPALFFERSPDFFV